MLTSLSPTPETSISWLRPSKYFRGLLSLKLWLPIATLSYSVYLWHPVVLVILSKLYYTHEKNQIEKFALTDDCESIIKIGFWPSVEMFFAGWLISLVLAAFTFVFVEKPAVDARRVFKSKW